MFTALSRNDHDPEKALISLIDFVAMIRIVLHCTEDTTLGNIKRIGGDNDVDYCLCMNTSLPNQRNFQSFHRNGIYQ